MNDFFFIWIVISLLFILFELGHPSLLLFLSFSCGALCAALFSLLTNSLVGQCTVFLAASFIAFLLLVKYIGIGKSEQCSDKRTNTHALVGRWVVVTQDISFDSPGEVKIGGELWMARLSGHGQIAAGTWVRVTDVCGAHVVVVPE